MAGDPVAHSVGRMYACAACGETIGTYEPLVWMQSGSSVEGSLIALRKDPEFDRASARLLHADCAVRSGQDR